MTYTPDIYTFICHFTVEERKVRAGREFTGSRLHLWQTHTTGSRKVRKRRKSHEVRMRHKRKEERKKERQKDRATELEKEITRVKEEEED